MCNKLLIPPSIDRRRSGKWWNNIWKKFKWSTAWKIYWADICYSTSLLLIFGNPQKWGVLLECGVIVFRSLLVNLCLCLKSKWKTVLYCFCWIVFEFCSNELILSYVVWFWVYGNCGISFVSRYIFVANVIFQWLFCVNFIFSYIIFNFRWYFQFNFCAKQTYFHYFVCR